MSQSSPSLLNSLRRFQFQKRPRCDADNTFSSEDKLQSPEESNDPADSDYGSTAGSSAETIYTSDDSNIKPVVINIQTYNKLDSEHFTGRENGSTIHNVLEKSFEKSEVKSESVLGIKMAYSNNGTFSTAHSISDSEEDQPLEHNSISVDDDDDDDVILCNPRPRTPKPIVVSDDEEDFTTNGKKE